jgi:hypothetical protein
MHFFLLILLVFDTFKFVKTKKRSTPTSSAQCYWLLAGTELVNVMPLLPWGIAFLILLVDWWLLVQGLQQQQPSKSIVFKTSPTPQFVWGLPVHRVPLRRQDDDSTWAAPYCLAVSTTTDLPSNSNFLATQVWPAARVAARALEMYGPLLLTNNDHDHDDTSFTICELGCGPGLPSLSAVFTLNGPVIATDIDDLALELVNVAALEQNISNLLTTRIYDVIPAEWDATWMDAVDLFIMSDIFEADAIARGAAKLTKHIVENGSKLWVFAQSDRAQREVFLKALQHLFPNDPCIQEGWSTFDSFRSDCRIWLCDIDETKVNYG